MKSSRGSATVEFVLLVPLLYLAVAFVMAAGRVVDTSMAARSASESAARASSIVSRQRMIRVGESTAMAILQRDENCRLPRVRVVVTGTGGSMMVKVTSTCLIDARGLSSILPILHSVSSTSTEVVDVFTFR